jgi:hypothetical protein
MEAHKATDLFRDSDQDIVVGLKILEAYRFWTKKRVSFNFIVGITGGFFILIFLGFRLDFFDFVGIIIWGLVANALCSVGYVLDSYLISVSKSERSLASSRLLWFWLGTIGYVIANLVCTLLYSLPNIN